MKFTRKTVTGAENGDIEVLFFLNYMNLYNIPVFITWSTTVNEYQYIEKYNIYIFCVNICFHVSVGAGVLAPEKRPTRLVQRVVAAG